MKSIPNERRALAVLSAMILIGIGVLGIPWFLTPPAYLDLALRDATFGADLSAQNVIVTDDATGKTMKAAVSRIGNAFVARVGRINSGSGSYTARISGYRPGTARIQAAALQNVRVPLDLTPTFGRLELSMLNATRVADPVAATVKDGARALTEEPQRVVIVDLPPGKRRLTAQAPGYCHAEREFEVRARKVTKAAFPLSPDLTDEEIARFVLGWRNEPRDLDSHLRKSDAAGFPSPAHLYWRQKTGAMPGGTAFAHLDVDELYPGGYETVTVRRDADGDFRYFVHQYEGSGTIDDAAAVVQVYTRGCQMRTFLPPPNCAQRIWNVTNLQHENGQVRLSDLQQCEEGVSTAAGFLKTSG